MKSTSYTSSFSFSDFEAVPSGERAWAFGLFVAAVVVIETVLWQVSPWFSDQAATYWSVKADLIESRQLDGEVAILGTSVLFHGVDPMLVRECSSGDFTCVNLALNGLRIQHQSQILDRSLSAGSHPRILVVELRDMAVTEESWISGPYFRHWATPSEFSHHHLAYQQPGLWVEFLAHRAFASYSYRRALGYWASQSLHAPSSSLGIYERNSRIKCEMAAHAGFARGDFARGLEQSDVPLPRRRPFECDAAGEVWTGRILSRCQKLGIKVAFLKPPAPPFVEHDRRVCGYDDACAEFVRRMSDRYPGVSISVVEPRGYGLEEFSDDHHLSYSGGRRLSIEVARWIDSLPEGAPE